MKHLRFPALQFLRSAIGAAVIVCLAQVMDLGTSPLLLILALLLGNIAAGLLLKRQALLLKPAFYHLVVFIGVWFIFWVAEILSFSSTDQESSRDFLLYRLGNHVSLFLAIYAIGFLGTWFYWCKRQAVTFEVVIATAAFVTVLSGHRNYYLDAPKEVSSFAWYLGAAPQNVLLGLGVLFTLLLSIYLALSTNRPLFRGANPIYHRGRLRQTTAFLAPIFIFLLFIGFASYISAAYSDDITRATNGVGMEEKEGSSPLGFHSAIGKTKQPAALVRLEGDYAKNPWSPMLYIREGALSTYNGRELVIAERSFDNDVPRVRLGDPYLAIDTPHQDVREELTQSIYLLTKHRAPFALDYPKTLRLIKNPEPARFELAYQALSIAPVIGLKELIGEDVGESTWDKATWEHYLRAPGSLTPKGEHPKEFTNDIPLLDQHGEDLRYGAMARKIAEVYDSPVIKAIAISQYLSKESIYTRAPGHAASDQGDPVAPYLFNAEKRGYCVHFSHAAVYMMRLVGIPARIATGYLTDLSYAKDGHILLHLGDRHAWPEIYVRGIGWSVVDVTPERAENEQVIVPDEKLLEELMSKLQSAEEFTHPQPFESETEISQTSVLANFFNRKVFLSIFVSLLLGSVTIFLLGKIWLRNGWHIVSSPRRRLQLGYVSSASLLADLGTSREPGETHYEFAERLNRTFGINLTQLTSYGIEQAYRPTSRETTKEEVVAALSHFNRSFAATHTRWKRIFAFFSPLSLLRWNKW